MLNRKRRKALRKQVRSARKAIFYLNDNPVNKAAVTADIRALVAHCGHIVSYGVVKR